ncbi:MAG: retropepsin-like domain-containing protein, partial [Bacteroidetes bacterium]|nr:retropepsin-like domain-containing protein [Bacteroidota bacterium]
MKIGKPSLTICYLLCSCLLFISSAYGQAGFKLPTSQKKDRIQFQFLNNLVIIPVEVNGTKLSFLLDTGVNNTLLF